MKRDELAALAQEIACTAQVPPGITVAVIVTDETGAFVGCGANCDAEYRDRMIWCAAHGEDRVDHQRPVTYEWSPSRSDGGLWHLVMQGQLVAHAQVLTSHGPYRCLWHCNQGGRDGYAPSLALAAVAIHRVLDLAVAQRIQAAMGATP